MSPYEQLDGAWAGDAIHGQRLCDDGEVRPPWRARDQTSTSDILVELLLK